MTGDPLYEPLGTGGAPSRVTRRGWSWVWPAGVAVVAVATTGFLIHRSRHDLPGVAVATIRPAPTPVSAVPPSVTAAAPAAGGSDSAAVKARDDALAVVPAPAASATGNSTVAVENGVKVIRFHPQSTGSGMVAVPVPGDALAPDTPDPLRPAPDPRVSENTPLGVLPRLGKGGVRPANLYARPFALGAEPRLGVLLLGAGGNQMLTADAARRLPPAVAFGFSPTAPDVATQVAETRHAGHEVMLVLPEAAVDPAAPDAAAALRRPMAAFPGYVGLVTGAATQAAAEAEGTTRGLLVLGPGGDRAAEQPARIDVDASAGKDVIASGLNEAVATARRGGAAVLVVVGAQATTADELAQRLEALSASGVALAPVSATWSPPQAAAGRTDH